jgi:sterol desaturase/sphingolipid hydroxylase (fatty acid hydroxylase superfamily)
MTFWSEISLWLGEHTITPVLTALHLQGMTDTPQEIAAALMVGCLQIFVLGFLFRPLEKWFPAEKWDNRHYARIDFHYTWLMLIGLFPLFNFLILTPVANYFGGASTGEAGWNLRDHFPWLQEHSIVFFLLYYLSYDFVYYWMHRIQHFIPWWWAMHSMHHSQIQMSCWSNDRSNWLDGTIQSFILAGVGVLYGVNAEEFAWMMFLGELVQCFSHANVRIGLGPVLNKIFVDPKFHRLHHMRFVPEKPTLHLCNFGQVFAFWDVLFGTALYKEPMHPTGVTDPMVDKDSELGVFTLQWESLKRFWGAVRRPAGWRIGEVIFSPEYEPIHQDDPRHDTLHQES